MFRNKFKSLVAVVYVLSLLSVFVITSVGASKVEASVLEKLTTLKLYMSKESNDASVIGSFNDGGTPGLQISSGKVIIGDNVYVGSSLTNASRVLTEKDLETIKEEIYKQVYAELKDNNCVGNVK